MLREDIEQLSQYYQIYANILEGRELLTAAVDTYAVIKIGSSKKRTKVQRKTDSPYFNEVTSSYLMNAYSNLYE